MVELRAEDQAPFISFLRMPSAMFDELFERVGPRLTKRYTACRNPLESGLKLVLTLRHLASRQKNSSMKFSWRFPHNTISVIVREVCQAIMNK